MNTHVIKLFLLPVLIVALGLMPAGRVTAQTFTTLHNFTTAYNTIYNIFSNCDGAYPADQLILSGNTLYGTATDGGTNGTGIVFSLTLGATSVSAPQLTIIGSGTNVILTWPANATGFTLQSTTNLVPPVTWSTGSGQNAVTNPISGIQKFYRLSQ
jgi:hypothetical protein